MPERHRAYITPMPLRSRFFLVSIEPAGIRWTGRCELRDGHLKVCSAWGYASRSVGRRKPENLARELMREILQAKLAELERTGRSKPVSGDGLSLT